MSGFTAKDVQKLRQASGAGMMDAKRALDESAGDFDAALQSLREKGIAKLIVEVIERVQKVLLPLHKVRPQ